MNEVHARFIIETLQCPGRNPFLRRRELTMTTQWLAVAGAVCGMSAALLSAADRKVQAGVKKNGKKSEVAVGADGKALEK
jgi:hypothetical protein